MHEVAGRVGWLLTELFALEVPAVARGREEMMALGREFGLGLQTVNVIRGLHSDRERGWVYVPRSFGASGTTHALFEDPVAQVRVLSLLVAKAERHLDAAQRYIVAIPRRYHGIRLFCLLPYLFAVRTLAKSRANADVFRAEVKISRPEVVRIARDARWMGWSNGWVRRYAGRLAQERGA
jgi:farnesyl-diphosphate farnesyltransferase